MHQEALIETCGVLARLNTPVFLLDGEGKCLYPRQPEAFILPGDLEPGVCQTQNGYLFLLLPLLSGEVLAIKDSPGAADFLRLTSAMIQAINQTHGVDRELDSALRRLLTNRLSPAEEAALARYHQLAELLPRCVLLITLEKAGLEGAKAMLESVLPTRETDLLVGINRYTAALIRDMDGESAEEMGEYAAALQDTLMNELGQQAAIGIGETFPSLSALPLSYAQASAVLGLSRLYPQENGVYEHRRLLLERFLLQTPAETAARFYSQLFNRKTAKLLNEDMLNTITVFFEKDLNLSDASRELYIHRNTLVYRLDKVQKQLGLDLRKFHDAMTFKLLLDLKKRASILPGTGPEKPGKGTP
ncbi:MAG: helix-turn-helix domain-containing protein [Eubacteriales bacterium]|nr:helix-turn-helix domain-containing protein [Eubacteriales bacterium]